MGEAQRLIRSLGLRKTPALLVSSSLTSPGVVGVLRPRVILPESLLSSPVACRAALAHELAHVQRRDLLWCVLARFVGAFLWFHPLYGLSVRELCVAQELACDTLALRLTETTPALYGKTLLAFATGEPLPPLVAGSASQLKRRLRALQRTVAPSRTVTFLVLLLLAPATIPWQLTHAQAPAPQATRPGTLITGQVPQELSGTLLTEDGQPLINAEVGLYLSQESYVETRSTTRLGSFRFRAAWKAQQQTLYIEKDGKFAALTVPVKANQKLTVRWETKNIATLTGRVLDTAGKPIPSAPLRLITFPTNARIGYGLTLFHADSQGRFSRAVWAGWRYRIDTERGKGYGWASSPRVGVEPPLAVAGQTHDFGDIILPRADAALAGTLVGLDGKPLAGVKVSVGSAHNNQQVVTTRADGTFRIEGLVAEPVAFWLINSPYELAPQSVPFPTVPLTLQARPKQKQVGAVPYFATTLDNAKALAAFGDRKILVEFTSHTCTNARDVEARVYPQPSVIAQLKRVVPLRLYTDAGRYASATEAAQNARYQKALLRESLIIAPKYALITTNGKLIAKTDYNTARDPNAFRAWLAR